jgi:hypothetical protein
LELFCLSIPISATFAKINPFQGKSRCSLFIVSCSLKKLAMIKMLFMLAVIYIAYRMFMASGTKEVDSGPKRSFFNPPPAPRPKKDPNTKDKEDYIDYEELK